MELEKIPPYFVFHSVSVRNFSAETDKSKRKREGAGFRFGAVFRKKAARLSKNKDCKTRNTGNTMSLNFQTRYADGFIRENEYSAIAHQVRAAHQVLHEGTGEGHDFLGWLDLPVAYDKEEFARIQAAAKNPVGFRRLYRHRNRRIVSWRTRCD